MQAVLVHNAAPFILVCTILLMIAPITVYLMSVNVSECMCGGVRGVCCEKATTLGYRIVVKIYKAGSRKEAKHILYFDILTGK